MTVFFFAFFVRSESAYTQAYTVSGFKSMFGKLMDKATGLCRRIRTETNEEYAQRKADFNLEYPGVIQERFTFHDLKAKGISDYEGDKQYFSGHTSKSMMEKYNRTADVVDIVNPKKLSWR